MAMLHSIEINTEDAEIVFRGYDPVAYMMEGRPMPGHFDLSVEYDGETYFFTTAENRDAFEANPRMYVPRHGG